MTAADEEAAMTALHGHYDAHEFVRLFQCSQCSKPLTSPVTLPCGNSLCQSCIPKLHDRENCSYPAVESRKPGFTCPFPLCGYEHSMTDCGKDVSLSKVTEIIEVKITELKKAVSRTEVKVVEKFEPKNKDWAELAQGRKPTAKNLDGGRIIATYTLMAQGELEFDSSITYTTISESDQTCERLDSFVKKALLESIRHEMDCQVDACMFHEAVTTSCGHTFCRPCLARVFDHGQPCPSCRTLLSGHGSIHSKPRNLRLQEIMDRCWPADVEARAQSNKEDEEASVNGLDTPLFVCSLGLPTVPTFLHIFEPRYRLMMRRAMDSGRRTFGMLHYNRHGIPQPSLGRVSFMAYGTLLRIDTYEVQEDGRSLIQCTGVSRFKVLEHGMMDGYTVGRVERVDDISAGEEERLEAHETATAPLVSLSREPSLQASNSSHASSGRRPPQATADTGTSGLESLTPPSAPIPLPSPVPAYNLDRLSTRALMQIGHDFIRNAQANSDVWQIRHSAFVFGECPDNPALFPWWFAAVVPLSNDEKYRLLPTTSVRERLKIVARWVRGIERSVWFQAPDAQCEVM